jgi:hypothetical protein
MQVKVGRPKHGVPHIGYHHGLFVEERVQALEQSAHGEAGAAAAGGQRVFQLGPRNARKPAAPQPRAQQALHEILEPDVLVGVIANGKLLARRVKATRRIEPRGEDAQIDVGEKRAEHDHAIARLDVLPDVLPAHGPFVNAQIKRVMFANDRFPEQGGDDGNVRLLRQPDHDVAQAETVDFHVGEENGLPGRIDHGFGLEQGGAERGEVAGLLQFPGPVMGIARDPHQVAGQLDIDRALVAERRVNDAIDFLEGRLRIAQDRGRHGELFEHLLLGVELADLVVQQGVFLALAQAGCAADHDHGGLLREGLRRGVRDLEPAYAIGDAHRAQPVQARVGVGGEARPLLVTGVDDLEPAVLEHVVEREDVIPGDAENMPHPVRVQALNEIISDGNGFHVGFRKTFDTAVTRQ